MPASPAEVWLPSAVVTDELGLSPLEEDADKVARARDAAVRLAERITRRPLTGRTARYILPSTPTPQDPVALPSLRDRVAVLDVGYWTARGPQAVEATDLADPGTGTPDVGRLERVDEDGGWWDEAAAWRLWPRAAGWPADARQLQVRLTLSVSPAAHEDLRQAAVALARVFYGGRLVLTPDELRGLELILPGVTRWLRDHGW